MDIVTIDFETYYDKDFSLSKMTTEAYVRDPRFEVIGVSVKVNNNEADWYSGDNPGRFLRSLDYSKRAVLCHNTAFDGAILSWLFGIKPKLWLDTMSMARPFYGNTVGCSLKALAAHYQLGAKGAEVLNAIGKRRADFTPAEMGAYGAYCVNDADLTYALFNKLRVGFPATEIRVIDQTIRMFTEPVVELDMPLLYQHLGNVQTAKQKLIEDIGYGHLSDDERTSLLMSNATFADCLIKLGVEPPTKISARTGKEAYAFAKTDKAFEALLEHEDERVAALVAARLGVKTTIEESRTQSLIGVAERGALPIMLNYWGAHTGRFSGGDKMNLQNLPKRGNNTIRRALKAPPGYEFVAADASQIEARLVAYIAGQDDLTEAFRQGRDVYSEFATDIYGYKVTKENKKERFVGKTGILSLGYGAGAAKFREMLRIQGGVAVDEDEAARIVRLYRQKYFKIVQLWRLCDNALHNMMHGGSGDIHSVLSYNSTGITLPNKLQVQYPALRRTADGFDYISSARQWRRWQTGGVPDDEPRTKIYGGKVVENIIQALAAQAIREMMVAVSSQSRPLFQVHDEIIVMAKANEAEQATQWLASVMSVPPLWAPDLPVACESSHAANYGDC